MLNPVLSEFSASVVLNPRLRRLEKRLKLNHKSRDKKALVFSLSVNCVCGSKAKEAKMALSSSKSDASSHIIIVPWSP